MPYILCAVAVAASVSTCTECLACEQLADQHNEARCQQVRRARRCGHRLVRLGEATLRRRPASEMHEVVIAGYATVKLVPIGHERHARFHTGIKLPCVLGTSPRLVREHPHRRTRTVDLSPKVGLRLWISSGFLEHLEVRLVVVDEVWFEQHIAYQVDY